MAAFFPIHLMIAGKFVLVAIERGEMSKYGPRILVPIFCIVFVLQILNTFGIGFETSYAIYFLGLVLFLVVAFVNFVFLLIEIWKPHQEGDA